MFLATLLIGTIFIWFFKGVWLAFGLAALGALVVCFRSNSSFKTLLLYSCCLIFTLASLERQLTHKLPAHFQHQEVELTLCFKQVLKQFDADYSSVVADVKSQPDGLNLRAVKLTAYNGELSPFLNKAGVCIKADVRLRQPLGRIIPGGFNAESYYLANNIDALANIIQLKGAFNSRSTSARAYQRLSTAFSQNESHSIWAALVLGWSTSLPDSIKQTLAANQLMHLFVVSGMHFSFIAVFVGGFVRLFARLVSPFYLFSLNKQLALLVVILVAYLAFIGFPIPAARAMIMLLVPIACLALQIRMSIWRSFGLVVVLISLWQPQAWLGASAWLSFVSVAVILLLFQWHLLNYHHKWQAVVGLQGAMLALSVLWSVVFAFKLNLFSFLIVLLVTPLVMFILMPLAIAVLIFPFAIPIQLFENITQLLLFCLAQFESFSWVLPWQSWAVIAPVLLVIVLGLRFARTWHAIVIALLAISLLLLAPHIAGNGSAAPSADILIFDVGHGQAVSIKTPQGHYLLDTGGGFNEQQSLYKQTLKRVLPKLDGLIASHADKDHSAAVDSIRHDNQRLNIWSGQRQKHAAQHTLLNCHESNKIDDYLRFIRIAKPLMNSSNNHSCILLLEVGNFSALLTSDADKYIEYYLMQQYPQLFPVDFILLGHHGSDSSSSEQWLELHQGSLMLVSNSNRTAPVWPSKRIQRWLEINQVDLLQTATLGSIKISIKSDQIRVKTWDSAYRNRLLR